MTNAHPAFNRLAASTLQSLRGGRTLRQGTPGLLIKGQNLHIQTKTEKDTMRAIKSEKKKTKTVKALKTETGRAMYLFLLFGFPDV